MKRATDKGLRDAVRRLVVAHGTFDQQNRPCGTPLSAPHAHALLELLAHPGGMTVTELAERLNIDRTNVSRLCARMEKERDIVRDVSAHDTRARCLRLTLKGRKLAKAVDERSAQHFRRIATSLNVDASAVITTIDELSEAMRLAAKGGVGGSAT